MVTSRLWWRSNNVSLDNLNQFCVASMSLLTEQVSGCCMKSCRCGDRCMSLCLVSESEIAITIKVS